MPGTPPPDGIPLQIIARPSSGWSAAMAALVDREIERLAAQYGWEHLSVWLGRDAWRQMAPYLQHRLFLDSPGVVFEVASFEANTTKVYIFATAGPEAKPPD